MTTKFSNNSFISLVSYKNLNSIGRYVAMIAAILFLAMPKAWGADQSSSRVTGASNPAAGGGVIVNTSNTKSGTANTQVTGAAGSSWNTNQTFYAWADPNPGYYWESWTGTKTNSSTYASITIATPQTATAQSVTVKTARSYTSGWSTKYEYDGRKDNGSGWITTRYDYYFDYTITANFAKITLTAPGNVTIMPTNPLTSCSEYTGTLTFTASHSCAKADFNEPAVTKNSGNGVLTVTGWEVDGTQVKVNYKFTGNNTYGGDDHNRANSFTVTMTTKADESASCNVTADFPNVAISDGNAETVYPSSPTTDVAGSAVFPVTYSDGAGDFTATITGATGGTWTPGTISFASTDNTTGAGNITVPFTFNAGGATGDFSATLTLTATNAGGATKTITLTAYAEPEATNDVSVTTAAGVTTEYATWATGWEQANKADGNTIRLLRNVDLGELTASQTITKNLTLDLNGKTLSASLKASNTATYRRMFLLNTANKTFTVTDSKTGGTIDVTANYTNVKYAIFVNQGNVILNGGKIQIENTTTGNSDVTYATGVAVAAGTTFTMNGGEIVAKHLNKRRADGVWGAGSATSPSTITINGGKITANAYNYAYGIFSSGIVNINGGEILGETVGTSTAYGIYMNASAAADDAASYAGTLNMTDGIVIAKTETSGAYGILIQGVTSSATESATDGTHTNKATAKCNITGGTIKALPKTTTARGVLIQGDTISKTGEHLVAQIKNAIIYAQGEYTSVADKDASIYGVYVHAICDTARVGLRQGDAELTNCTITAIANKGQNAAAVYVHAVQFSKLGEPYKEEEVATAGKVTINSGTYTAETTTGRYAYAVQSAARVKSILGKAEAYPTIIIHGGKFTATTGTTTARAVNAGGHTTIDGGEFIANAGSSDGYGIYHVAGKLKVSGVKIKATAPTNARGVSCECAIHDYTGYEYHSEAELNNLNDSAITTTGSTAYGVVVTATNKLETQARYDTYMAGTTNAVTKSYYDRVWSFGPQLTAAKVTINGGTYTAIGGTTTAYAAYCGNPSITTDVSAWVSPTMEINNATLIAKTNGTTTAGGVYSGGTTTVNNCDITVKPMTTTGYGVFVQDNKTTVNNTKITVTTSNPDNTKSAAAYGLYVNAAINYNTSKKTGNNYLFQGELVANEGNDVTVTATSGTTAYGIYVHAAKVNIPDGDFIGDYAYAGKATINGGKYTATASGTTAYAAGVAGPVLQGEATATPTLIINDGKFKGTATSTYADVSPAGEPGYFVLNGGYYVKDENLDVKLGEGMNKVAVKSGTPEYTEGYRWRVTDNMTGEYVCKIKENSTSYASLEEALQVVNATPNSTWTIIMIANYTLSKGDYVLPAKTTLLIPYQSSQTTINGATPAWVTTKGTVIPFKKLTFASGVNMTVFGKIEASSTTYIVSSTQTAIVGGPYGQLDLNEGSYIDLENDAFLYAWGYVTGEGTINAKNGSTMYEDFQMGDWHGGGVGYSMNGNKNSANGKGTFMLNYYYFQNIESTVIYRPGSKAIAYSGTVISDIEAHSDPVNMVGTSDAMFLMDPATAGENTWVKKKYDPETDKIIWTLNSGASIGSVKLKVQVSVFLIGNIGVDMDSKDYVLPITSNFVIIANEGDINISNDVAFLPGVEVVVKKEANLIIPANQYVYIYDQDDWSQSTTNNKVYFYTLGYSPSWKTNPRSIGKTATTKLPDAKIQVEGTLTINGKLFTTASGANVCSTRENAGKVIFNSAVPSSVTSTATTTSKNGITNTLCQLTAYSGSSTSTSCTYTAKSINPVWLKNEDGTYSKPTSANTSAGDTWVYMQSLTSDTYEWTKASEDGCFTIRSTGDTKTYVHPSDWVAVGDINANHAYPSEDATRMFVNTEAATSSKSCVWWEVNSTPEVIDGTTYYVANNENFDNFGTYYYWDNTTSYWKPKKITVTWQNEDGTKITNGTYGDEYNFNTSPQFFGTNPKKTPTAIEKYDWIGWRDAEGNIYDKNATLPRATSDVTYTAYFNTTKYQYTITFKNDDNSDLWAGLVNAGTTGAELQALFETKYNEKTGSTIPLKASSVDKVYTFSSWNTSLATVTAAATYTANYTWVTRKYHVTFYSYDAATVLYEADVDYNTTRPVYGGVTPFRSNTSAYSYEWTGWQQGATHYGTTDNLALVTGDVYYVATFSQTTLKYQVLFKRQDGSIIDAPFFSCEETPSAFPADPTMASTVSTDYTFREWSPATLVPVTEDGMVYTALFDESPRQYTAHFVNYNGTSLNVDQTIDYNTVPAYMGAEPIKPNDSRNSYEFSGWAWAAGDGWEAGSVGVGETLPAIKGNITFTAQYTPTLLQFDVIYQREDGFVILRDKKKYDESSAFPTTYAGATSGLNYEDATYTYTFDHWSPATVVNPVTANATYTAYYNWSIKTYSITAVGISPAGYGSVSPASLSGIPGGSTVTVNGNTITVNGTTITATPAPADAQYTYTFSHWNNVPATVTGNVANIEAVFTRTVNQYDVIWKNADGTVLETDENVDYGTTPTYDGATPTQKADASYVYTFNTWTPTVSAVTGNTTYTATYSTEPTVASVTAGGETTYYATLATAIAAANGMTNPTVKMLQNVTFSAAGPSITTTMTFDLNGKTIQSTRTVAASFVLKVNKAGITVTITDSGTGGKIDHTANIEGLVYGIHVAAGTLNIEGGTIYAKNTAESTSAYGAYGIYSVAAAIINISNGSIEAWTNSTSAFGIESLGELTMTGGTIYANATSIARGIRTRNTTSLTNATITAETTGDNSIAVYNYSGTTTINSGTYTANGAATVYAVYLRSTGKGSTIVNGGKFNGASHDIEATSGTTAALKGGYYVHQTKLATYCATNYHVFDLAGQSPYKYEVAEGYTITFKDGDNNTIQSGAWKKGVTPSYSGDTPTKTEDEDYTYTFNDTWSPTIAAATVDATYTAQFDATSKETGFYVDIVDVDNSELTLNVSGWANTWPYTINGTKYIRDTHRAADRTMKIPYSGSAGDNFTISIKDKDDNIVSKHTYVIPQAVTSSTELSADQTKSLYVKGTTLTVNANTVAKNIYVAPDAKLVVNSGKTLTADTIFLRTTPAGAAELVNNGTIATTTKVFYTRIIKSKSGYFQFGLPLSCTQTANEVRLSDGANPKYATSSGWILRYYDESSRAEKGVGDNWKTLNGAASVAAGKGYEMYSGVNYYREFYFPVDLTALTNKVAVSYTAGNQTVNNGWNVIVSPLTSTYTNDPAPEGMTVSWMQLDGSFEQGPMTTIAPAKTFAYQTSKNGYISFASSVAAEVAAAPRRRVPAAEEPERIQWIHLDILNADGEGDQTSIYSHPTRYEQTYKTGIDVAKQSLTASRAIIYSSHAYGEMAFAGVADSLLESGVALTVYSPVAQELTFSLRDNEWLNRMEYVWLIDNETGAKTDLLSSDYSYEAAEGTTRGRFFIQGQFKAPQVATELEPTSDSSLKGREIRKVIINQKMFIEVNGRLYDATGKEVKR